MGLNTAAGATRATLAVALAAFAVAAAVGSASAAPAQADTWDGRCSVTGTLTFEDPFGAQPTSTSWRERGAGHCTGVLNGVRVANSPIIIAGSGSGTLSCLVSGADVRLANIVTFTQGTRRRADDAVIAFAGRSATALGESVALMYGDVSGEAMAHVDFLTSSGADAANQCSTSSVTSMRFRAMTRTLSTMRG